MQLANLFAILVKELAKAAGASIRVPRLYVRGEWFSVVARAMSLALAFTALVLGVVFLVALPGNGRLTLGDGLTFVGFLLTAASFFATAGKPDAPATLSTTSDPKAPPRQTATDPSTATNLSLILDRVAEVLRSADEPRAPGSPDD